MWIRYKYFIFCLTFYIHTFICISLHLTQTVRRIVNRHHYSGKFFLTPSYLLAVRRSVNGTARLRCHRSEFRDCTLGTASSVEGHFTPHVNRLWIKQRQVGLSSSTVTCNHEEKKKETRDHVTEHTLQRTCFCKHTCQVTVDYFHWSLKQKWPFNVYF